MWSALLAVSTSSWETATGEILRVIGTSPTNVQPVFETIARSGVSVCRALGCVVFVVDGDMIRVAVIKDLSQAKRYFGPNFDPGVK